MLYISVYIYTILRWPENMLRLEHVSCRHIQIFKSPRFDIVLII
jgi:hypothetical protein